MNQSINLYQKVKVYHLLFILVFIGIVHISCISNLKVKPESLPISAKEILGNSKYMAISAGFYRDKSRDVQPTIEQIQDDLKILSAMGIKLLRTYNVHLEEAENLLKAIAELQANEPEFEMYVMLGAWIDCKDAWTDSPDHNRESERNDIEIEKAVALTNQYPDIVKMIAVGNEAMVKWATSYYVEPNIILKWVNYLQNLKKSGNLPKEIWITSSDNFASWGGGGEEYHVEDLNRLIKAVDFISMHTYPMHDTHYNPQFWGVSPNEVNFPDLEKIDAAMFRARNYAISQFQSVVNYLKKIKIDKPVHIGETGWASHSNEQYGDEGSRATDEYKSGLYYKMMRNWSEQEKITCFYFEAFDEIWKNGANPQGSENHFGLFTINGQAKYALWDMVDKGIFDGLSRNNQPIAKTYLGDEKALMSEVKIPFLNNKIK